MKRVICVILVLVIIGSTFVKARAIGRDKEGYLIISNNFCIIVRAPSKQLTANLGQEPIGILLKDKTQVTIRGGYLAFTFPIAEIRKVFKKYHLEKYTLVE